MTENEDKKEKLSPEANARRNAVGYAILSVLPFWWVLTRLKGHKITYSDFVQQWVNHHKSGEAWIFEDRRKNDE